MPMDKSKYPPNWSEISKAIRERDGNRCKWCDVPNHERGARDRYGVWHSERQIDGMNSTEGDMLFDEYPHIIRIVLTVAHLDHDTTHNDPHNLAALCQRCHLNHDRAHHTANMKRTIARKRRARISATGQQTFIEDEHE